MTLEFFKNMPTSMIAKNPSLIKSFDQTTNHPLIRKYSIMII